MIRGSVDLVTTNEVLGWAFAPNLGDSVLVQAVLHHEIIGEAIADIHRPDLAAAGLGDGNSGFTIGFFRTLDPIYLPFVVVKVNGGDTELPRAPMLGFSEFFTTLYSKYPATGRQRSVFGGLWIDRTDAGAMLRGKVEIGQVAADAASTVERLINDGIAVITYAETVSETDWDHNRAEQVGELLDDDLILAPLRAILEDNPLAVAADLIESEETSFAQATGRSVSPSPTECVELIVAVNDGVALEVVRNSHSLPEFTDHGQSRWAASGAADVIQLAGATGFLDRHELHAGSVALIGPGTIYRIHGAPGSIAVRIMCLPARGLPLGLALDSVSKEKKRKRGARIRV